MALNYHPKSTKHRLGHAPGSNGRKDCVFECGLLRPSLFGLGTQCIPASFKWKRISFNGSLHCMLSRVSLLIDNRFVPVQGFGGSTWWQCASATGSHLTQYVDRVASLSEKQYLGWKTPRDGCISNDTFVVHVVSWLFLTLSRSMCGMMCNMKARQSSAGQSQISCLNFLRAAYVMRDMFRAVAYMHNSNAACHFVFHVST